MQKYPGGEIQSSHGQTWEYFSDGTLKCYSLGKEGGDRDLHGEYYWNGLTLSPKQITDANTLGVGVWNGSKLEWFLSTEKNSLPSQTFMWNDVQGEFQGNSGRNFIYAHGVLSAVEGEKEQYIVSRGSVPPHLVLCCALLRASKRQLKIYDILNDVSISRDRI